MKRLLIGLLVLVVVSCSTPSTRLKIAELRGKVVWRSAQQNNDKEEVFVIEGTDDSTIVLLQISYYNTVKRETIIKLK